MGTRMKLVPVRTMRRQEELKEGQSTLINGSTSQAPAAGEVSKTQVGQTWCVANAKADEAKLQTALDYACGEGGADCNVIQPSSTCYNPNTLEAHASYAFNSYYQKKTRAAGTCEFGGAAHVVSQRPDYGNCEFPTGY
ncbi:PLASMODESMATA CALLOSE-BINDING PROTEIN 3 [Hibiscus syriacus]|uniref:PLASMODESMATA CALLOSE-BINDING PROTEIN 3 n=1 Tax=Hibiscus syriacus TaxID=106335 RepID=A0A6A3AVI4_HIBSY|nr:PLASMODESMATA CALLOSE-BINDING PROTEIN 3 [Hibiscus syriacus]